MLPLSEVGIRVTKERSGRYDHNYTVTIDVCGLLDFSPCLSLSLDLYISHRRWMQESSKVLTTYTLEREISDIGQYIMDSLAFLN